MEKIILENKSIFITGAAGFIGSNLVKRLFRDLKSATIVGVDNMNAYYDVSLKEYRVNELDTFSGQCPNIQWTFVKGDIADKAAIDCLFDEYHFDIVVNLAAQAGVRYSIENPDAYIQSNLIGFYNILEACRNHPVEHLVYASSSSVYGGNKKVPFSTDDRVDNPVSLYAATKKSNELMAHCYSKLYDIPSTGLRFFTVYGPAGRPDMAYFGFTNKLLKGETIQLFNYGNCRRDFTYVDDIVEVCFLRTTISKLIRNSCRCSLVMCPLPMPMQQPLSATSVLPRKSPCEKAFAISLSGINSITDNCIVKI